MIELDEKWFYIHGIHCSLTSDHNFIECMLPFVEDFPEPGKMTFSYRNYKDIDLQQFCHDLEVLLRSKNWSDVSLNETLRCFNESIVETMNIHAPIIKKKFSQKRTEFTNPTIRVTTWKVGLEIKTNSGLFRIFFDFFKTFFR